MEKVTIIITTYNLDKYIKQCLDSVLTQKTNFKFKVLIGDDCSTDNTVEVLKEYESKYPDVIKVKLSDKNIGSLSNSNRLFREVKSQYFAFLDGDDYWVDENRLQKQVDFLDRNQKYSMCAGNTQYLVNEELKEKIINENYVNRSYSFNDFIEGKIPFVHTSSILVRNSIFINGLPKEYEIAVGTYEECALRGEDFRRIIHLEKGDIFIFSDLWSVYRIHNNGLWQGSSKFRKKVETTISNYYYFKHYWYKYGNFFKNNFLNSYNELMTFVLFESDIVENCSISKKDLFLINGLFDNISSNKQALEIIKDSDSKFKHKKNILRKIYMIDKRISKKIKSIIKRNN